jgi:RNA polymerase sigma factor (sigma-70 family)
MSAAEAHHAIETVFRIERARLIAGLARMVRDVDLAEELAQDALVTALAEWPNTGVPNNPGAWLMAAAKRRAIDAFRRNSMRERKHAEIGRDLDERDIGAEQIEAALDDDLGDELLGLIFAACHPALSAEARAALTLRLIGGLTTDEIARAFLTGEATIAQRIVRAKKTLGDAGLTFEVPRGPEREQRLASVLEVIYLIFNEGYAATAGEDLIRPALCAEAQRLGRILAGVAPNEPEVFGLLALMEIQASRLPARTAPDGAPVMLPEQNRALGPAPDPPWPRRPATHRGAGRRQRTLCAAGRARRLSRAGAQGGRYRLEADRGALRHAARGDAVAGGRSQPGRGTASASTCRCAPCPTTSAASSVRAISRIATSHRSSACRTTACCGNTMWRCRGRTARRPGSSVG